MPPPFNSIDPSAWLSPLEQEAHSQSLQTREPAPFRPVLEDIHDSPLLSLDPSSYRLALDEDDLCKMPQTIELTASICIMGDLHGNALKLFHFLVKHRVILNMTEVTYNKFARLYLEEEIEDPGTFIFEIRQLIYALEINASAFIVLLGDELADRGQNDLYTLWLFDKLHLSGVQFDIIQSNHGLAFSLAHEKVLSGEREGCEYLYFPVCLDPAFSSSMLNMSLSLERNTIPQILLNKLIDVHQSHQKIMGYALNHDGTGITLFTHAPVDYTVIKDLAKKLQTPYIETTASELACSIDKINEAYLSVLKSNLLHTMITSDGLRLIEARYTSKVTRALFPFEQILWNRNGEVIDRRGPHRCGYSLTYVHGHDSSITHLLGDKVFCLDSESGKDLSTFSGCPNPVLHLKDHFLSAEQVKINMLLFSLNPQGFEVPFKDIRASLRDVLFFNQPLSCQTKAREVLNTELKFYILALNLESIHLDVFCQKSLDLLKDYQSGLSPARRSTPRWDALLKKLSIKLICLLEVNAKAVGISEIVHGVAACSIGKAQLQKQTQKHFFWEAQTKEGIPSHDEEPSGPPPPLPKGAAASE